MATGKCPKCGKTVDHAKTDPIKLKGGGKVWPGVSLLCPSCDAVLGIQMDPLVLKEAIIEEIVKALQGH